MAWIRVDDDFPDHVKVSHLSLAAVGLHLFAICAANRALTDGRILEPWLTRRLRGTRKLAQELVDAGLWEPEGKDWRIHDYLDYQRSREEVQVSKAKSHEDKVRAGRAGAAARWHSNSSVIAEPIADTRQNNNNSIAGALAGAWQSDSPKEKKNKKPHLPTPPPPARAESEIEPDPVLSEVILLIEKSGIPVSRLVGEDVISLLDSGTKPEWFRDALREMEGANACTWKYARAVLTSWGSKGPPERRKRGTPEQGAKARRGSWNLDAPNVVTADS